MIVCEVKTMPLLSRSDNSHLSPVSRSTLTIIRTSVEIVQDSVQCLWSLEPLSFDDEDCKKSFAVVRSTKDPSVFRPGRRHPALHRRKKKKSTDNYTAAPFRATWVVPFIP